LFWDVVDELDVRAEQDEQVVEYVAKEKDVKVDEEMKEEEFIKLLEGDERIESMDLKAIKSTFEKVSRISALASQGQLLIVPRHCYSSATERSGVRKKNVVERKRNYES